MREFLFLEMSGLDPHWHCVLEAAWIVTDDRFEVRGRGHTLVKPYNDGWGPDALAKNGLSMAKCRAEGMPVREFVRTFHGLLWPKNQPRGRILAGQRLSADLAFLVTAYERGGIKWRSPDVYDTHSSGLIIAASSSLKHPGLGQQCEFFGIEHHNPHSAKGDVWATLDVARTQWHHMSWLLLKARDLTQLDEKAQHWEGARDGSIG